MTRFALGVVVGILLGRWRRRPPAAEGPVFWREDAHLIPPPDAPAAYWTLVARA